MKRFVLKISLIIIALLSIEIALLELVPKDTDSFLYEYNHKLDLLRKVSPPRVIIVGGSSVAFNTDSRMIADSLNCNVINFGLHAGTGARVPILDCYQYIREGDIVVMQIEYSNYFHGGYGEVPALTSLMVNKDWENVSSLNFKQWKVVLSGVPKIAFSNLKRLFSCQLNTPPTQEIGTSESASVFEYKRSGFNEFGDEVSHYSYASSNTIDFLTVSPNRQINKEFLSFLHEMFVKYEERGAKIVMIPPACIDDYFEMVYIDAIGASIESMGYPYCIMPYDMTLSNDYAFDTKYHLNRDGVTINSERIISCLEHYLR